MKRFEYIKVLCILLVFILLIIFIQRNVTYKSKVPSNSTEALVRITEFLKLNDELYEANVRKLQPNELINGQGGGIYVVEYKFLKRIKNNHEIYMIMNDGHILCIKNE